jgi:spoIIIJ-associated protein
VSETLIGQISTFLQSVVQAMGLSLTIRVEDGADGSRINLDGEDGGVLVRRGGEGLQALQHLVATTFRRQLGDDNRIVIDCNGFRREKARNSGMPQEMGPLNPYERRIVNMAVAEIPDSSSESIGDAFMKTVIISSKS